MFGTCSSNECVRKDTHRENEYIERESLRILNSLIDRKFRITRVTSALPYIREKRYYQKL